MVTHSGYSRRIRSSILGAVAVLILLGFLLQSVAGTAYYSMMMQAQGTVISPEVVLQNGTVGTSTIYTSNTSAKASVEAPLFDYVDNNEPDVDSSADEGMHSNFPGEQAGPDSTYDTLEEENTEAIEDSVDVQSDVDSSADQGTHSDFDDMKVVDGIKDALTEAGGEVAISKLGTDTSDTGTSVPLQFNHVQVSGTNRIIIVAVGFENNGNYGTVSATYGGDPMTLAVQGSTATTGYLFYAALFYILDGDLGSDANKQVSITASGTIANFEINAICTEYENVFQGPPQDYDNTDEASPPDDTIENTGLSFTDGAWVISAIGCGDVGSFTHAQGQVEVLDFPDGTSTFAVAELQGTSGESTLASTYSTGANRLERVCAGWNSTGIADYKLDLEVQFTDVIDFLPTEKLCIYTGTLGSEDLRADYWNGTGWENLATDLTAYSYNEYAVSLTSTNFTVRFKGGNETGDTTQDQWQIDATILRVEGAGDKEDAVDQQSNVDGPVDIGSHSNFTAQQYGPDSINDTLTEADTSFPDNNNVDSEIVTDGSTTGISGAQTVDGITENITEGAIVGATPVLASYEVNEADAVTSISVNKPTGTSSGDLLIILLGVDGTTPQPSTPTGFTYITTWYTANSHIQCSWYREADGTEGASFSSDWSGGNAEDAVMACLRITGWDSGDFPHKIATDDATSGDPVFPAVTTEKDNCLLLRWYGMDDDDDTEPIEGVPSGHDEIFARATGPFSEETTLCACNRTWTTAGDTGTATWDQTATIEGWNTVTLAIAPPVVGYQLDVQQVVNSIAQYENYNLTTRAYRSAENFYLQLYNFSSSQWVNMSTITASSSTWYNTTLAKADFVNSTNQARIRYWQGAGAAQETLYVDYSGVCGWNATNYELDLEGHWTDLPYSLPNEEICIYSGAVGTEDITVDVWNGSSWINIISDMNASAWNNVTITSYLTSSNFTIRFKGGSETGDASQDTWQIDVALIHVWHDGGENYQLDLEVQWTNAVYTRTNETLSIKTGPFSGSEDIQVRVWNSTGSSWHWVMNLTASQWNNVSITSYLTSSTFTVQFLGGTETGDITQDSWNIDTTLLHVWGGASAWLSGWDKRVRITIDRNDIDTALSNFPILVYLSNSSSGRNNDDVSFIFDELQNDINRKKIAVTKSDGLTQCYIEIEKWDDVSEQAWLWVEVPNVSNTTDTDLYLYYDKDHADNTAYVDDTNMGNSVNVWNSNFKMVQHMRDNTTSSIVDSTSNYNDGTKTAAGEPAVTTSGKISDAQDFDGSDDYIDTVSSSSEMGIDSSNTMTVSAWVNPDVNGDHQMFVIIQPSTGSGHATDQVFFIADNNGDLEIGQWGGGSYDHTFSGISVDIGVWQHFVITYDGSTYRAYKNGTYEDSWTRAKNLNSPYVAFIGSSTAYAVHYFEGIIDEVRISNVSRSAAWIKASYESGRDDLLDFASEEGEGTGESTSEGTYDYVLRVNNTVSNSWQIRLKKYSDSNINRLQNCTIYFHNSTDETSSQIIIENGSYINQTGPWYDLGDSETIYIAMTVEATSTGTSYVYTYLEIRTPGTSTYAQYIITFEIT